MSKKFSVNNVNCCVYGCSSKKGRDNHLSFHRFPAENKSEVTIVNKFGVKERIDRRRAWTWNKALLTTRVTPFSKVCSLHFQRGDFILQGVATKMPRLKQYPVPSQNLPKSSVPLEQSKNSLERARRYKERNNEEMVVDGWGPDSDNLHEEEPF